MSAGTGSQAIVADTDDLQILYEPGTTDTAIVSFTGVGLELGGVQEIEFSRSLRSRSESHHVYFVTDRGRSWFNKTKDKIVESLAPLLLHHASVVTLGNSMGGFGALYFSGLFPNCRRAISFVPQFSVTLDSPEPRWMGWRSKIQPWIIQHALENLTDDAPSIVLFGAGKAEDIWHIEQFRARLGEPHVLFVLPAGGHNVAKAIRRRGLLPRLIEDAACRVPASDLAQMLAAGGLKPK